MKLPSIIIPATAEKAYTIAGKNFAEMWSKITGIKPDIQTYNGEYPNGNIIVIGSDAVNPISNGLIKRGLIDKFNIRYGTDDYHVVSVSEKGQRILVLAGGSGRSTIYAVYDFFRKKAGAEYFWDGDVIPKQETIDIAGIDIYESPRFLYRGLRYFAHRGLHRFQAEHWDFEDWKREIDWILKKRFNIFMLRIGIDDLFQRAFPESVPYPPEDGPDEDAVDRSYNDRTSFWSLKYRGELREKVLQYAFDRELLHPEDTGTMTHWYSRTPSSFLKNRPDLELASQSTTVYNELTGKVWDIEKEQSWNDYWKLTETHIKKFGQPRIFHTIGLAERKFGKNEEENLQIKLYAYRKIQQVLRKRYPDAPLLVATWDFIMYWKDKDVQNFLLELDPEKTIMLDYAADLADRKAYKDWGLYRNFPWIFGIFHAFASNSEIRGNYKLLEERLNEAAGDPMCRGMVFWPELSHSDTFMLEYIADNSWNPSRLDLNSSITRYCQTRYPEGLSKKMNKIWYNFLCISQSRHWGKNWLDPIRSTDFEPHFNILERPMFCDLTKERIVFLKKEYNKLKPLIIKTPSIFHDLAVLSTDWHDNPFWHRDAIDMARTVINRALHCTLTGLSLSMDAWRKGKNNTNRIKALSSLSIDLMRTLGDLLSESDDYSLFKSMQRLGKTAKLNPHTEQTLKSNSENSYCRSQVYELVRYVYQDELAAFLECVKKRIESGNRASWKLKDELDEDQKKIRDEFYSTPLSKMAPLEKRSPEHLCKVLKDISNLIEKFSRI